MKKVPLSVAIATAMLVTGMGAAAPAIAPETKNIDVSSHKVDRALQLRYVRLSQLADVLAATTNDPSRWTAASEIEALSSSNTVTSDSPLIAWVSAEALSTEAARAEAASLIRDGIGVLVSGKDGAPRHDASAFGIQGSGSTNLYLPRQDGTLDVHATNAPGHASKSEWRAFADQASKAYANQTTGFGNANAKPQEEIETPIGPSRRFVTWEASPTGNGAAISMEITVVHDAGTEDRKLVMVKTRARAIPFRNGVTTNGWPESSIDEEHSFAGHGSNHLIYNVGEYRLITRVTGANVLGDGHYPKGETATDFDFTETQNTETSFDWSVSGDLSTHMSSKGIESVGKLMPKTGGSKTIKTSHTMAMKVKDYSTSAKISKGNNYEQVEWTYSLAPHIKGVKNYFNSPGTTQSRDTSKTTPMMHAADLEGYSQWKFLGQPKQQITIASTTEIHDSVWSLRYDVSTRLDWPKKADAKLIHPDWEFPNTYQPTSRITLDLGATEITKYPVVALQSMSGNNLCLYDSYAEKEKVTIESCRKDIKRGLWAYDHRGRYVNQQSGRCLSVLNGMVIAEKCSDAAEQVWEWQADRIHQKFNRKHRLYVNGKEVMANFTQSHKDWPIHVKDQLLPPWNNYPLASFVGDLLPAFDYPTVVPSNYPSYGQVSPEERWIALPVVHGLYQ